MEQKQTAVEHIENAIQKYMAYYEGHYKAELFTIIELNEAVKEAKEMEKQQIMDAIIDSEKEHIIQAVECYPTGFVIKKAEQYYNKEYRGNNEQ